MSPSAQDKLYARMGELLGVELRSEIEILVAVEVGLPASTFKRLSRHLPGASTALGLMRNQRASTRRARLAASERLIRVTRILALAEEPFGDRGRARQWCGQTFARDDFGESWSAAQMYRSEFGARAVEEHLLRASHGFTA